MNVERTRAGVEHYAGSGWIIVANYLINAKSNAEIVCLSFVCAGLLRSHSASVEFMQRYRSRVGAARL